MSKHNNVVAARVSDAISTLTFDDEFGPVIHPAPADDTYEALMSKYKTKSAVIRHLDSLGWKRGKIASFMNIRYQHVRNVLTQPLKKVEIEAQD